jgi:hypothetical protein
MCSHMFYYCLQLLDYGDYADILLRNTIISMIHYNRISWIVTRIKRDKSISVSHQIGKRVDEKHILL